MTDPKTGYDIKVIRSGSGKLDTTYSARACKPTKLDKKYQGTIDLEGIVRSQIKSYDELEDLLSQYLNEDHGMTMRMINPRRKRKREFTKTITWKMMNLRKRKENTNRIFKG